MRWRSDLETGVAATATGGDAVHAPWSALSRLATAVLALSVVSALLGGVHLISEGAPRRAVVLVILVAGVVACTVWWWKRRGTTTARWATAFLILTSALSWALAGNLTGIPLLVVAISAVVIEFGLLGGLVIGVAITLTLTSAYLAFEREPVGGIVVNVILVGIVVSLGVIGAQLLAELDRARRSAEQAALSRRSEALAEMDRALAAERMTQARVLHNDLGGRLTLIGMGLDLALRLRGGDDDCGQTDGAWEEVERARSEASGALADLRTQVRALSPLTVGEAATIDLDDALDRLAGAFSGTGLTVVIKRRGEVGEPPGVALDPLAYRIIQEGLTNVARHSVATTVTVTISSGPVRTVHIADDGGPSREGIEPGFGLHHLRDRIETIGGTFETNRGPSGFVLLARYPANEAPR